MRICYLDINKICCTNKIMLNNTIVILNMVASHRQFTDEAEKLLLGSSTSLCKVNPDQSLLLSSVLKLTHEKLNVSG